MEPAITFQISSSSKEVHVDVVLPYFQKEVFFYSLGHWNEREWYNNSALFLLGGLYQC
jgi:hypothetical protein